MRLKQLTLGKKLVLVLAGLMLILSAFILTIIFGMSSRSLSTIYEDRFPRAQGTAEYYFADKLSKLAIYSSQLAEQVSIVKALGEKDRSALESILVPLYERMHLMDKEINTIEVTDAQGVVLMRGHNPGKYGDNKSNTPLFGKALSTRKAESGAEVSTSTGLLSFDAVTPVFSGNEFKGLVKVGSYPKSENLKELKRLIDGEVAILMEHCEKPISQDIATKYEIDSRYYSNQNLMVYGSTFSHDLAADFLRATKESAGQLVLGGNSFLAKKCEVTISGTPVHEFSILVAVAQRERQAILSSLGLAGLVAGGVTILAILLVAVFINRSFSNPIAKITMVANDVSMGDIQHDIDVTSRDEIGDLAESFRRLIDYLKSLAAASEKIAANDLTVQVEPKSTKDVLGNSFKTMVTNLTGVIRQLTDNSTQLVSAATEIATSSEQMARGSKEQTSQSVQVSGAVEEMTATIVESSRNAGEAARLAKEAANAADQGTQVVSQTIEGMNRIAQVVQESAKTIQKLSKSSDQIGEIISVIDDIADQTNLLALNAAIEAARAGEQGRGFAVVADEVRKLAERTTKATKEITDMIKGIQSDTRGAVTSMEQGIEQVQAGRKLADKAGESLTAIAGFSQRVMDMIQQLATASEQQSSASEEIARSIEEIAKITKENATGVEQSAAAAEQLNRQAKGLRSMVANFRIDDGNTGILSLAQNDHVLYIGKLRAVMDGQTRVDVWKTVDAATCRFGKWYHSPEAAQLYAHLREFQAIRTPHKQVHDFANHAVKAFAAGDTAGAHRLFAQAKTASQEVIEQIGCLAQAANRRVAV